MLSTTLLKKVMMLVICIGNTALYATNIDSLKTAVNEATTPEKKLETLQPLVRALVNKDNLALYQYAQELLSIAETQKVIPAQALAREMLGHYYYGQNKLDSARMQYQIASDFHEESEDTEKKLLIKSRVGIMHLLKGEYPNGELIFRSVEKEAIANDLEKPLAFAWNQMGTLYHYQGIVDSASLYYNKSTKLYQELKDTLNMLRPMFNHAVLNANKGKKREAIDIYLQIKEIQEKKDSKKDVMVTNMALARTHSSLDESGKALDYASEALQIAGEIQDISMKADILFEIANIYRRSENFDASLNYFNKALDVAKKAEYLDQILVILLNKGNLFLSFNENEKAEESFSQAMNLIDEKGGKHRIKPTILSGLATAYFQQENINAAKATLEKVQPLMASSEAAKDNYYYLLAKINMAEKEYDKAIANGELVFDNMLKEERLEEGGALANILAKAYEKKGDYEKALQYYKTYKTFSDSLANIDMVRAVVAKTKDLEFEFERKAIEVEQQQEEARLMAQTRQSQMIALGIGLLALLGFGSFWNAQRQNKVIAAQNKQLEQLNQTKDRIFAIIGHDIRKPVLAFQGITEKINFLLHKKQYNRLQSLGQHIEKEASNLYRLTDNLLNWALMQRNVMPHHPERLQLSYYIEEVFTIFEHIAEKKNISFQSDIPPNMYIQSDKNALRTILRNLVDNAIKYSNVGDSVTIEATTTTDNMVNIHVSDSGIGMTEAQIKKAFVLQQDKSQEGTAHEKGTGLGLHLVHELVKLNQGTIDVASQIGKGTRFTIALPKQ